MRFQSAPAYRFLTAFSIDRSRPTGKSRGVPALRHASILTDGESERLRPLRNGLQTQRRKTSYFLGRLAPYRERACIRLATPAVSRAPRMMW